MTWSDWLNPTPWRNRNLSVTIPVAQAGEVWAIRKFMSQESIERHRPIELTDKKRANTGKSTTTLAGTFSDSPLTNTTATNASPTWPHASTALAVLIDTGTTKQYCYRIIKDRWQRPPPDLQTGLQKRQQHRLRIRSHWPLPTEHHVRQSTPRNGLPGKSHSRRPERRCQTRPRHQRTHFARRASTPKPLDAP